jgi:hypothetical protein
MRKIVGQGKLTKFIASKIGAMHKDNFLKLIYNPHTLTNIVSLVSCGKEINLQVVSYSSHRDFSEQVLSILSFIRYVGTPLSWTIYSDGSHTNSEVTILKAALPFVRLVSNTVDEQYFSQIDTKPFIKRHAEVLAHFAQNHCLGKKLLFYLNHSITEPTLFLDSDVLFYNKASIFHTIIHQEAAGWYLPDEVSGCLDSRYERNDYVDSSQINSGFLLLNKEFDTLSEGLSFVRKMNYTYEYFSEQTVFHILSKQNELTPFGSEVFILNTRDQFDFSYAYTRDKIAIRHYTGPVRHKMWQRSWKWQLSLT